MAKRWDLRNLSLPELAARIERVTAAGHEDQAPFTVACGAASLTFLVEAHARDVTHERRHTLPKAEVA